MKSSIPPFPPGDLRILWCLFSFIALIASFGWRATANSTTSGPAASNTNTFVLHVLPLEERTGVLKDSAAAARLLDQKPSLTATALNLIVNDNGDATDTNVGDGLCDTSAAPGEQCTLRAAIQEANATPGSDTIGFSLSPGSIITLNSALEAINSDLVVNGPGANVLTVKRSVVGGTPDFRIITINSGFIVTIGGLTISNGSAVGGSFPDYAGGGILSSNAQVTLTNLIVTGNRASSAAGGIDNTGGSMTISFCTIDSNTAAVSGGGVSNNGAGTLTINNSTISNNQSGNLAGGFYNSATTLVLNSTISSNGAVNGGGVDNVGWLTLKNNTVAGNNATGTGGGIHNPGIGILTFTNTLVANNSAPSGPDCSGQFTSQDYNLIGDSSGAQIFGSTTHNITNVNASLGPLASDGGPTKTHALLPGSQAIDAGDNSLIVDPPFSGPPFSDQRNTGFNRLADGNGDGTATVDIGSYEVQSLVVTNVNDSGPGSLRQAITDANVNVGTDAIGFQAGLTGPITLLSALPNLSTPITIDGPVASQLTIQRSSGTPDFRIFTITAGTTVNISFLRISNGRLASGNTGQDNGAGIHNSGILTINKSEVTNNTGDFGAGIYNIGSLTILNSSISNNRSIGGPGAAILSTSLAGRLILSHSTVANNVFGSAIFIGPGTGTINHSTISNNTSQDSGGGILTGGFPSTTVNITNSTITGNRADLRGVTGGVGGGVARTVGTVTLRNTIVAGNVRGTGTVADDISGTVDSSSSFNLIGTGGSGGLTNGVNNNQVGVADVRMGPLANNGGPTQTHALLPGSPALDAGSNANLPADTFDVDGDDNRTEPDPFDQRGTGFNRVVDGPDADTAATVDVGAFEAQVSLADIPDMSTNEDSPLSFSFNVGGSNSITSIGATSSNTTLVPNGPTNLNVTGSGPTRALTVAPVANLFGTTTITLTIDSVVGSMSDTFVVTVNPVADTPSVTNTGTDEDTQTTSGLVISRNAVDGAEVSHFKITNIQNGTLFLHDGLSPIANGAFITFAQGNSGLKFTPAANFFSVASFDVQAGLGNTDALIGGGTTTATITVNAVNDPPIASNDSHSTPQNTPLNVPAVGVLANDTDIDNIALTALLVSAPAHAASFALNTNGAFNYTPAATFVGNDSFTYKASDGTADSNVATVTITVNAGGTLEFSATTYNIAESAGNATISITRTGGSAGTASVNFITANGTATGGTSCATNVDYLSSSGMLSWTDGETGPKTFVLAICDDSVNEENETVNLVLSNPTGSGSLGTLTASTLTIINDDLPVLLTEENTQHAVALDSVTQTRDPFTLTNRFNSPDQRRRVSLFVWHLGLLSGDTASAVTVRAEDDQGRIYPLTVEYVGAVAELSDVTQVVVRLPDEVVGAPRDLWVTVSLRGPATDRAFIKISGP